MLTFNFKLLICTYICQKKNIDRLLALLEQSGYLMSAYLVGFPSLPAVHNFRSLTALSLVTVTVVTMNISSCPEVGQVQRPNHWQLMYIFILFIYLSVTFHLRVHSSGLTKFSKYCQWGSILNKYSYEVYGLI